MSLTILKKTFKVPPDKTISFLNSREIENGEIIGLWGNNGIGKTTLLKNLYTELSLCKYYLLTTNQKYKIGIMPQNINDLIFPWLKVDTIIDVFQSNFSINSKIPIKINNITNCSKKIGHLSGGEKQVLAFELMLNSSFEILFLDEPFSAMDSLNINAYKQELIKLSKNKKTTIFIVLHDLLLLQNLSDICLLFRKNNTVELVDNSFKKSTKIETDFTNMLYNENSI